MMCFYLSLMVKIAIPSNYPSNTKKDKDVWATSGQGDSYSQKFKPIASALRAVTMRGIA